MGVTVGYETLVRGSGPLVQGVGPVRTGVTAILPRGREGVGTAVVAGAFSFNGNGEMTGTTWIEESGSFNTPILITNTHSVGACHEGSIRWMVEQNTQPAHQWMLPVVAETWDGYVNDLNGFHIRPEHAIRALDAAHTGPIEEGAVGGGTGMICYGFGGGSGTSSRIAQTAGKDYTVGVFIQANFGDRRELTIAGVPVGLELLDDNPVEDWWYTAPGSGSAIIIVATDAPLLPGQCKALARRVPVGLGRTGTTGSHFSGDLILAFSTANPGAVNSSMPASPYATADEIASADALDQLQFVRWGHMDSLFEAAVEATEEAVLNVLAAGSTTIGYDDHRVPEMPKDRVMTLLTAAGRITK